VRRLRFSETDGCAGRRAPITQFCVGTQQNYCSQMRARSAVRDRYPGLRSVARLAEL
jgi:hypothetical protein